MPLILAVDDSPSMRKMVSFTLTGAGHQVVEAVDGVDAYEKAQSQSFDLVLTDQNMPRLDGLGLTRKLREHPQFKTTPDPDADHRVERSHEAGRACRRGYGMAGQAV